MTETLGARLAQARRELGVREGRDITPSTLAGEIGVTPATVYRWESDEKAPRDSMLLKLARHLGVTPSWLRYGQEPKRPDLSGPNNVPARNPGSPVKNGGPTRRQRPA